MSNEFQFPAGFRTAGVHCGVKKHAGVLDLALFVSDAPCTAAAVFTQNKVVGAPVKVSRIRVPRGTARGVVINSGNANACTGEKGDADARWMTAELANHLGCDAEDVLVCSTGVIGHFLPLEKLKSGIPLAFGQLANTPEAFHNAARAIMTTDTVPKQAMRELEVEGKPVRISGCAKGAAMIGPNMATMLSVIMTDAALTPDEADRMLREAVNQSFNSISVEGHMSTSDTVILLAQSPHHSPSRQQVVGEPTASGRLGTFQNALNDLAAELAQAIIRDAEGANHFITIDVTGARSRDEAHRIAKTIAEGPLVKTAIAGGDPNWGRIVSAVGYSGIAVEESEISLRLNGTLLYEAGTPLPFDASAVSKFLKDNRDVSIELMLSQGEGRVRFWTSDLTAEYVRLNADYTT
jgi:glutamate N-acetyltransferase/amino-acid N-acetyltransferase